MNSTDERDIIQVRALKSLEFFTRYFFKKKFNTKFIVSEHHAIIIDVLEKIVKGELKRVIFNMPPRYGKTELIVKNFIAWCLTLNDSAKFIHLSYSDSLALDNSEEIKDLLISDYYQEIFPKVKIKKGSSAKNKWYTENNGGVLARSSSGQVTGFGAGRVDDEEEESFLSQLELLQSFGGAIIIDDPIKPDDATSDVIRDKINLKFETTIRNRTNSRNTPIIIVMQRLHDEDLSGYLSELEPDEWTVISMPAIKEDGTPLWEHKHNLEDLNKIKSANNFVFETQYMQNPTPSEGLLFEKSTLNYYNGAEFDLKKVEFASSFIDVADSGDDNHCVPIGLNVGEKIFIHDVLFTKLGTNKNVTLTANILNKYNPEWVRVESNMGGQMYSSLLSKEYKGQLLSIRAKSNKQTRINTLAGFIMKYCYFRTDYPVNSDYYLFMQNLTRYMINGVNKHDDAPDAMHGICNMIRKFYPHLYDDFVIIGDRED
jgi:predicted phage terminase large subunit-like protein